MLYLWHVTRTDGCGYDEFDGFIVAAETESEARHIHPYGEKWETACNSWGNYSGSWPVKPSDVIATCIGTAAADIEAGTVLLASFNAG